MGDSEKERGEYYANLPYTIVVEKTEEQGGYYIARYVELKDLVMTGDTAAEAVSELEAVKQEWFETQIELGNEIPLPVKSRHFSGNLRLRMDPSLHQALTLQAINSGVSLNHFIVTTLAMATGEQARSITSHSNQN